jgi:type VI secretion system protein ImpJ
MHLGPQHFQMQNRYFESLVHFTTSSLWYESHGLIGVQLDTEAMRNGTLALLHARGIFPDGLAFHIPEYEPAPEPRQLVELFPPMREHLDVYLAIPPQREDGPNCAESAEGTGSGTRFVPQTVTLADELTGRDERPVKLGRKNFRLLADTEIEEGGHAAALPLARLRRDATGQYAVDPGYIPPVLQIGASERIMILLRRLVEILEEKCKAVVKPKDLSAAAVAGFSAQGISNAWFLHCVNSSLGPLRHLCFAKNAHPEELYREMLRLAGALCTFGMDSHPAQLPLYAHRKLAECFDHLDHHIRTHLELVAPSNCVEIELTPAGNYFWEGGIADERTLVRSRWIFGIRARAGESEIITSVPRLVKICSKEFVPKLVARALPGLTLRHLPVPPPAISPRVDMQYFAMDKAGACWDHMVATRRLGVYVPGELPEPYIQLLVVLES